MWMTDVSHIPLDLTILIPESNLVSKLKVRFLPTAAFFIYPCAQLWNYNKTVKDAAKGVQECEVWISGNCWWHGVVDKGCGNQVFDYATVIPLLQSHQPHQPAQQKPTKTRPQPKSTTTTSSSVTGTSPSKPPPSFLTVDNAKLPRSNSNDKGLGLTRSTSNDGKSKLSVQEQGTRNAMSKSLPPKGEEEPPRYYYCLASRLCSFPNFFFFFLVPTRVQLNQYGCPTVLKIQHRWNARKTTPSISLARVPALLSTSTTLLFRRAKVGRTRATRATATRSKRKKKSHRWRRAKWIVSSDPLRRWSRAPRSGATPRFFLPLRMPTNPLLRIRIRRRGARV